jgi:hypothetical protein
MQHQGDRPTREQAERAIQELDLEPLVTKCREEHGWSDADAEEAVRWYRNHLLLCYLYPDRPISALSREADQLWHCHILDTVRYREDCQRIFGEFLDHQPIYGGPTEAEDAATEGTARLYDEQFGRRPAELVGVSLRP